MSGSVARGSSRHERRKKPASGTRTSSQKVGRDAVQASDRSDFRARDLSPVLHRSVLILVFALIAVLTIRQVGSLDAGFHLKSGEYILSGHLPPSTDRFTYTIRDHAVVNPSWGYDVLLAATERLSGSTGLVLLHSALVMGLFFTLVRTTRLGPADPTSLVLVLLVGGLASEMRFEVRPELASYMLLALVLHLLHRYAEGKPSPLWALPLIHLAWANLHSLFILGWAAIGCFVIALGFRSSSDSPRSFRLDRRLALWGAASVVVTLLNPYGWRGVLFPFSLATRLQEENVFAQSIGEFTSPFALGLSSQFPFYPRVPVFAFRLLVLLSLVSLVASVARRRLRCALLWAVFGALAFRMIRNVPLFVIATLPATIWGLPAAATLRRLRIDGPRLRGLLGGALLGAAVVTVVLGLRIYHDAYYIASRRPERFGTGWNRLVLPIDAVRFAERARLSGPVLNHLNFGGYLMWARPDPVFIDGRLEVVGEEFHRSYLGALSSNEGLEACAARYGIRWLIFPYTGFPKLLGLVSRSPRWRLVYADHLAAIFVREGPEAENLVDPALAREAGAAEGFGSIRTLPGLGGRPRVSRAPRWVSGLRRREEFPTRPFNRGTFHLYRNELAPASRNLMEAIVASAGAYYELYNNLGAVLFRAGRLAEARDCYTIVLEENPADLIALRRIREIEGRALR